MSETTHTPWPWPWKLEMTKDTRTVVFRDAEGDVLLEGEMFSGHRANRANARLIAAAPELLEALKEAVELYESSGLIANSPSCGRWVNKSRDAIAKTEGRE